jgi:hypothetical protein
MYYKVLSKTQVTTLLTAVSQIFMDGPAIITYMLTPQRQNSEQARDNAATCPATKATAGLSP